MRDALVIRACVRHIRGPAQHASRASATQVDSVLFCFGAQVRHNPSARQTLPREWGLQRGAALKLQKLLIPQPIVHK